jgi:hypothetical protein
MGVVHLMKIALVKNALATVLLVGETNALKKTKQDSQNIYKKFFK